jgi:hypothetical protein
MTVMVLRPSCADDLGVVHRGRSGHGVADLTVSPDSGGSASSAAYGVGPDEAGPVEEEPVEEGPVEEEPESPPDQG